MFRAIAICLAAIVFCPAVGLSQDSVRESPAILFRERVEPILRQRCFRCHSHSAGQMEGGLTLDWRSGWSEGGGRGAAIVIGAPAKSLLIQAIQGTHPELEMPPDEPLPPDEVASLIRWVDDGAFDDRIRPPELPPEPKVSDWWSLRPLTRPPIPATGDNHPIDAFIRDRLRREGIPSSPAADRRVLIRRLMNDLVGLPPTLQETDAFVTDSDPDAYERLVDRLLDSPRHGERWARHWLDTIHFADSHGFEHDVGRDHAWRFRDYVISALNQDTSWSRFICEQLAADVLSPERTDLTAALGFLGAGPFDFSAFSTAPLNYENVARDDLVAQTMAAFVSTTASCARCHDHKFDPITQEDYYALQAVFAGLTRGNLDYDPDPKVARERQQLQGLLAACERRDPDVLFLPKYEPIVAAWTARMTPAARWVTLDPRVFVSAEGTRLSNIGEGVLLADGSLPEKDTYTIVTAVPFPGIRAMRLEVLPHDSLPMNGPGRRENGNFHLSEIEVQLFEPGAEQAMPIPIRAGSADFNQADWEVEKAIDGNVGTAWGIHPAVGHRHQAVFEFTTALPDIPDANLTILLHQEHGRGHLIGSFRLAVTKDVSGIVLSDHVSAALAVPTAQRSAEQRLDLASAALTSYAESAIRLLPDQAVVYAAGRSVRIPTGNGQEQARIIERPPAVHVLQRGDVARPGHEARAGSLSMMTHLPARFEVSDPLDEGQRRAALANWIAHPDNVLTWRSVVNRVWQEHFGRGLCDTPSDFGRMGSLPSHPELLDWLAVWFRDEAGGSLKELHRLILTSVTWQQSSQHVAAAVAVDSENRLFWRQQRRRLDAEAYRDFTRAIAGTLDLSMGGPAVQHFSQRPGPQNTPQLDYSAWDWAGPSAGRRSIYRCVWRGIPDPFMERLDFPDLGLLAPVRGFSASSLQALALFNNDFVLHHAAMMAQRVERESADIESQAVRVVESLWCRRPTSREQSEFAEFARTHGLASLCRILLNSNEFLFVD